MTKDYRPKVQAKSEPNNKEKETKLTKLGRGSIGLISKVANRNSPIIIIAIAALFLVGIILFINQIISGLTWQGLIGQNCLQIYVFILVGLFLNGYRINKPQIAPLMTISVIILIFAATLIIAGSIKPEWRIENLWRQKERQTIAEVNEKLYDIESLRKYGYTVEIASALIASATIGTSTEELQKAKEVVEGWKSTPKPRPIPKEWLSQTVSIGKGEIKETVTVPDQSTVHLESNKTFYIVERCGINNDGSEQLSDIEMPVGKSKRYFMWGGIVKLKGMFDDTNISITY